MDALDFLTQILSHSQLNSGRKYSFNPSPQGLWHLCRCVVWLCHLSLCWFLSLWIHLCTNFYDIISWRHVWADESIPLLQSTWVWIPTPTSGGSQPTQWDLGDATPFSGHHGQLHSSANPHRNTDVYTQLNIEQNIFFKSISVYVLFCIPFVS